MKTTHLLPLAVLFSLGLSVAADAASSRIYRTVDKDGNVVFTDIPPREDEKGEQIKITQPNSFTSEEAAGQPDEWIVENPENNGTEDENTKDLFSYNSLEIKSPGDDEPVRDNAGNITIVAVATPRLKINHRMRLVMDGQVVQEGYQSDFTLRNVDRGTHTVATEIVDDKGNVLIRSPASTFHMLRVSI